MKFKKVKLMAAPGSLTVDNLDPESRIGIPLDWLVQQTNRKQAKKENGLRFQLWELDKLKCAVVFVREGAFAPVGGAFGGKESRNCFLTNAVAVAAAR